MSNARNKVLTEELLKEEIHLKEVDEKEKKGEISMRQVSEEETKEIVDLAVNAIDRSFDIYKRTLNMYNDAKYNRFNDEVVKYYKEAVDNLEKAHSLLVRDLLTSCAELIELQKKGELYVES